jgi:adenosylmethionine-8-amino-7-oxononanoate aminotransferase
MSHVFHREPNVSLPTVVAGDGPFLIDREGKRYIDASGGAAVSCLGHSDRAVIDAIKAQLDALPYAHTSFFTNEPAEALADALAAQAPAGLARVFLVSGGSESVEAALKLARQYHVEVGQPSRRRVVARRQSYHGGTLGGLSIGGNLARRELFGPILSDAWHVSPCYAYRERAADETDDAYAERLAAELDAEITRLGPESVMAFVAETVVGATLGAVPPVPGYFRRVREVCDRHGVLLILDEVMCGMGRTGTMFACAQEGIVPDLLCVSKGIGAGYQPLGAMLVHERIYDAVVRGSGAFRHAHTFMGHAAACAAGVAVQRAIAERGLLARVRTLGDALTAGLRERFAEHPFVGDVRGRGLFVGVELVADRASKRPFDPSCAVHKRVKRAALQRGMLCYPNGGTADGVRGDHVLLAPPFIIEAPQLDTIVETLAAAIDDATTF